MQQRFKRARSVLASLVVAFALIGAGARPAGAQDATAPGAVQFLVTPYLWLAGINTTIQTPLERAPTVNSDVSAFGLPAHRVMTIFSLGFPGRSITPRSSLIRIFDRDWS